MFYKIGMMLMKTITLTLLAATAMSYYYEGAGVVSIAFLCTAVASALLVLLLFTEHRSKKRNALASSVSFFEEDEIPAGALSLVLQLPERPVMYYKGEVFDFVHNDPTAPDPV